MDVNTFPTGTSGSYLSTTAHLCVSTTSGAGSVFVHVNPITVIGTFVLALGVILPVYLCDGIVKFTVPTAASCTTILALPISTLGNDPIILLSVKLGSPVILSYDSVSTTSVW